MGACRVIVGAGKGHCGVEYLGYHRVYLIREGLAVFGYVGHLLLLILDSRVEIFAGRVLDVE